MDSLLTSNSMRMLEKSMDFLWAKQAAHLDNVTNAETPGYKVKTVTFEENFATKLRTAATADRQSGTNTTAQIRRVIENASWTVDEDSETTRMDENGVNLIEQSLEAVRTAYQIQYVMQSISKNLSRVGIALNG